LVQFADDEGLSVEEAFHLARKLSDEQKERQNPVDDRKVD
jgi:hypothetical protein